MQIKSQHHGAMRTILDVVDRAAREDKVDAFQQFGPCVRFSAGTYVARASGLTATCTMSATEAVIAWARKAHEFLESEAE